MSTSINKIILMGRLGSDAKEFKTGDNLNLKFSVATDDYAGKDNTKTNWHNCSMWGKLAEALQKYLVKGKLVYIEGELHYWQDKDEVTRSEIKVQEIKLLPDGGKKEEKNDNKNANKRK